MSESAATPTSVALSLVSHTNVGKTTLARTLLRRDVGEVRDEAHVTESAARELLIETAAGDGSSCGTRPASATACGSRSGWRRAATRSAGS